MRTGADDRGERGVALLLALAAAGLIAAVAASLLVAVSTESLISGNVRAAQEVLYAADAGLERAVRDLAIVPDWTQALQSPHPLATFDDGAAVTTAPDGRVLSMPALTAERQAMSNRAYGAGTFSADRPVWRLFGHALLARILPPGLVVQPGYVVVWVADDGLDGDGDPTRDLNGRILVYAEAYGVRGARRGIESTIGRAGVDGVRMLSWRDTR